MRIYVATISYYSDELKINNILVVFYRHVFVNFSDHDGYYEFHYCVKIPINVLKNEEPEVHKYKYHVESSATKTGEIESLEFIVGPNTAGDIIDRFLVLYCHDSQLQSGCK